MIYKCDNCHANHDGNHECTKSFKKFDNGKLRWHLMPDEALTEVLKVFEHGAKKYGSFNWLLNANEVEFTRLSDSLERHHKKFKRGQDFDEESGLYELAHLVANALMLLTYQLKGVGIDDRIPKKEGNNE